MQRARGRGAKHGWSWEWMRSSVRARDAAAKHEVGAGAEHRDPEADQRTDDGPLAVPLLVLGRRRWWQRRQRDLHVGLRERALEQRAFAGAQLDAILARNIAGGGDRDRECRRSRQRLWC